jgi:putative selenium metabolism protein SsnA
MAHLIIDNAKIVDFGSHRIFSEDGVVIEGGRITQLLKPSDERPNGVSRLNAEGRLLLPSFINAHTHFYSSFARGISGIAPSKNFSEILENLWWRLDKKLILEDTYWSAVVAQLEGLRNGTTTFIDHHASPKAITGSLGEIERAAAETGVRTGLCYEVSNRDGPKALEEGLDENQRTIEEIHKRSDGRFSALFGLHASFTIEDSSLKSVGEFLKGRDIGVHIHCAEDKVDQKITKERWGREVVERLSDHDLLNEKTILAHCNHLSDREIECIAKSKSMVVFNHQSNMNNAVGLPDIQKFIDRKILFGLGTDAMTHNMLEELRTAIWAQKHRSGDPDFGFGECSEALLNGNLLITERLFGLPVGRVEEGAAADFVISNYDPATPLERENLLGHLVFGLSQSSVYATICDGRILFKDGEFLEVDEKEILSQSRERAQALWKRI